MTEEVLFIFQTERFLFSHLVKDTQSIRKMEQAKWCKI